MMLDFYGIQRNGENFVKKKDWLIHFDNLQEKPHNYLRITRILKCLKEIGLEKEKNMFLEFLRNEIYVTRDLDFCQQSYESFWKNL